MHFKFILDSLGTTLLPPLVNHPPESTPPLTPSGEIKVPSVRFQATRFDMLSRLFAPRPISFDFFQLLRKPGGGFTRFFSFFQTAMSVRGLPDALARNDVNIAIRSTRLRPLVLWTH